MITAIIFTKDRAMQLDLLLRSIKRYSPDISEIFISYNYSSEDFLNAYANVARDYFKDVVPYDHWINQSLEGFKNALMISLGQSKNENILMLCDDSVFINEWTMPENFPPQVKCISLYLHPRVNWSFGQGEKIKIPKLETFNDYPHCEKWQWDWTKQDRHLDWGYPHNVAGHIYRKAYISEIVNKLDFDGVNSLEGKMSWPAWKRKRDTPYMMCFDYQPLVGMALNVVQTEIDEKNNLAVSQYSIEELNKRYLTGERIVNNFKQVNATIGNYELDFYKIEQNIG